VGIPAEPIESDGIAYTNGAIFKVKIKGLNRKARFKNVSNNLNTNIYSYIETSGNQSSTIYLNGVHFFNTSVN
jgi:hypothetical protein